MFWQLTSGLGAASQEGKHIGLFSAPSAFRGFWDFGFQTFALPWRGAEALCAERWVLNCLLGQFVAFVTKLMPWLLRRIKY